MNRLDLHGTMPAISFCRSPMRVVLISKIRDEADILDIFLRYHQRLTDHMIIMNHASTDSSRDILRSYEGPDLTVVEEYHPAHRQIPHLTALMNKAATQQKADWILSLDADEFLRGGTDVRSILETLPTDKPVAVPWQTYVPHPEKNEGTHLLEQMPYRRDTEPAQFFKVLIPGQLVRSQSLYVGDGTHHVCDMTTDQPLQSISTDRLSIAHFPIRSPDQFRRKVRNCYDGLGMVSDHFTEERSFHLLDMKKHLDEYPNPSSEQLADAALWFAVPAQMRAETARPTLVYDPVPFSHA